MSNLTSIIEPGVLISYADDSYIIVEGESEVEIKSILESTIDNHFNWLKTMGMVCNMAKTELIAFGIDNLEIEVQGTSIKAGYQMKVLGSFIDSKLSWETNITKIINKCRSFIFSLRYLRKYLDVKDAINVFRSHVISRLTYGSPVWAHSITYNHRQRIRSLFFHIIRIIIRDFKFKMSRTQLLKAANLEGIDDILFKRASSFIYSMLVYLEPTNLVGELISKSYINDRYPARMSFFDTSRTRVGRVCMTNAARSYSEKWKFDYIGLSVENFKKKLHEQMHPLRN